MRDMASLVFRLQNAYGLLRGDQTGLFWLMLKNKTGKWIPYNQADIYRSAGVFPGKAARTIQGYDVLGVFHDDIFGPGKRNHLRQFFSPCLTYKLPNSPQDKLLNRNIWKLDV